MTRGLLALALVIGLVAEECVSSDFVLIHTISIRSVADRAARITVTTPDSNRTVTLAKGAFLTVHAFAAGTWEVEVEDVIRDTALARQVTDLQLLLAVGDLPHDEAKLVFQRIQDLHARIRMETMRTGAECHGRLSSKGGRGQTKAVGVLRDLDGRWRLNCSD